MSFTRLNEFCIHLRVKGETKGGGNSEGEGRDERRGKVRVRVERGEPVNLNSKLVNSLVRTKRR